MNATTEATKITEAAKIKTKRLRTADEMQGIVTQIAMKHGLDLSATGLSATGAYLRLEREGFKPLVIDKLGPYLVSVAHHYQHTGEAAAQFKRVADPDVVFFTGYGNWIPIEITQRLRGYRRSAELSLDDCDVKPLNPMGQVSLTYFCEAWARDLQVQNWLELGSRAELHEEANRKA